MDHEGKITDFNAVAEKTFGYSRAEAIGKDLAELIIPPSQRETHRRALAHYRAIGEGSLLNKRIELVARRADNTEFPIELTVTKIGDGWPPSVVGFVRDITERKRAEEEIQRHRQRALILHEINCAVTSSLDLRTVIAFLLQKVDSLLPYAVSTLRLLNKETGILEPTACRNIDETEWKTIKWKPKGGLARMVVETGVPLVVADARHDPRTRDPDFLVKHGLFSYLGLPLVSRSETLGVISFYTKDVYEFTNEEIEFLSTLAGQAATAIHNSQLYEHAKGQAIALEKSNQRTTALHKINLAITSSLNLKTVLDGLLENIDLLLPHSVTTVRLLNRDTGELDPVTCRNIDETDKEAWKALKWKGRKSLAKVVLETNQPLIVPNIHLDQRTRNPEILKKYGLVSYLGVPFIVRGETLGLIAFYTKGEHQFSDEEIEFLSTLASQAAIAIHNSQLYEKAKGQAIALERSHKRTRILHEINVAITSSLDLKAMLDLLLARIESLLPYRVTTVRLLNKQSGMLEPVASWNIDVSEWKAKDWTGGLGLSNAVLETRAPVVIANARMDSRTRYPERIAKYGLYSFLGLPLIVKGELLGVISFYTKEEHHFGTEEIEFLSALASQAAIAIHNSQLYEKAEEQRIALQKSEERFRTIAHATNDAVWDWNLVTNAVWWNEGVRTLFGYSEAEVGPDANWWYENIHPDDRERVIDGIHALITSDVQLWSEEYRFKRFDGSFAYVFDRGYVIYDIDAKPVRMIGAIMDMTERKEAEEKLAQSENRLRTIIASEPECVKLLNRNGTLLEMNPAGLAMIEAQSIDEVLGKSIYPLVVERHRPALRQLTDNVFRGQSGMLEFAIIGLRGTHRWLQTRAVPLRDPKGEVTALLGITRDVTERKKAEAALQESEARYRSLFNGVPVGLYRLLPDGTIKEGNPALLGILGYTDRESLTRLDLAELYLDSEAYETWWSEVQPDRSQMPLDAQVRRRDGAIIWVRNRIRAVEDSNGKLSHYEGAMQDITERKRLEKEVLEISEKERERVGRDLHDDLGQHLAGISFLAKGLQQKLAAQSSAEARKAKQITDLLNEAISQTRNIARGFFPVQREAGGLMCALEELISGIERRFSISCELRLHEPILFDNSALANHVYRIAQEAVANAVHHGKAKRIVIDFSAVNGETILSISDDGIGFPEDWRDSTGIGLHIMRYRANMIGGNLRIYPGETGGAVVAVQFRQQGQDENKYASQT